MTEHSFSRRPFSRTSPCLCFFPLIAPIALSLLALSSCSSHTKWESYSRYLEEAERFERQRDYHSAIASYRKHIAARLREEERKEWENPHFYHLLIGDIYLKDGNFRNALKEYTIAKEQGVSEGLLSDRFRLVANWLADRHRYEEAIEILNSYRPSDPLLYDLMRDRLARMLVHRDETILNDSDGSAEGEDQTER
ncbi:hypothetical protein MRY87_05415 [bacterium]|nr:hypothetical protein [bacterium]